MIGTATLRPYMHGFFLDLRLYTKAKAIANPFAYSEHRQKLIADKLEKERESRIRSFNKQSGKAATPTNGLVTATGDKVKVNKDLVERIKAREEKENDKKRRKLAAAAPDTAAMADSAASLLQDDRFSTLFTNPDFAIDESSKEFAMLNPSAAARASVRLSLYL